MNPDLERLKRALRAAHEAGNEADARRFAQEIRRLQHNETVPAGHALVPGAEPPAPRRSGMAAMAGSAQAAALAGGHAPRAAAPAQPAASPARERGRESATTRGGRAAAAVQGYGSGMFGIGTPATAAGEFVRAALPGGDPAMSPGEAMDYARGRREGLQAEHPREFYAGMGSSIVGGVGLVRAGAAAAPRAATVFTPQAGQTARNLARLSAAGAAAAGVTGLNEEGVEAGVENAGYGAILGPAAAGALRGAGAVVGGIHSRIDPNSAAMKLLARKMGEPVSALVARYQDFLSTRGRAPRLVEIMRPQAAQEMGQISRVRAGAGEVFGEAQEQARLQLPGEMGARVQNGGVVSSPTRVAQLAGETRDAVAAAVSGTPSTSRVRASAREVTTRRDATMDAFMQRTGSHHVPVSADMVDVLKHPDVWGSLDGALRRRLSAAIEAGEDIGSINIPLRTWDMIRQDLSARAGAGAGTIYAGLSRRVRDYVGNIVPEYEAALTRYGQRGDLATGIELGSRVLRQDTRDFVAGLHLAGGGTAAAARRPETREAVQRGAAMGARKSLAAALGGGEQKADRFLKELSGNPGMRERLRAALSPEEATNLERLAERYGHQLDFAAGMKAGSRVVSPRGTTEEFETAMEAAHRTPTMSAGARTGARSELTHVAGESPASATRLAQSMAEDPGLQRRIAAALDAGEAERLRRLGESVTSSTRRLAEAAPSPSSQAHTRALENAETIQQVIRGTVIAAGRWSGAFLGNFTNNLVQRMRLSKKAARKLAEMATDPVNADKVIRQMQRAGLSSDEVAQIYRDAAVAAGIQIGRD